MTVFADTSGLYAALNELDRHHGRASNVLPDLLRQDGLLTHNYVVVELVALLQRRIGARAAQRFIDEFVPSMEVVWITEEIHAAATSALLAAGRRRTSLVDWVSFEVMRREQIATAFAIDRDFVTEGFRTVP